MRTVTAIALATLASVAFLVGCGSKQSRVSTPHVSALGLTASERTWFERLGLKPSAAVAGGRDAARMVESIGHAADEPGVELVSLDVYRTPRPSSELAPAIVLAVAHPARFLRHRLKPMIPLLHPTHENEPAFYLHIVDARAKTVLEWTGSPDRGKIPNEGSVYVRPDLMGCSPVVALGWDKVPPCPVK